MGEFFGGQVRFMNYNSNSCLHFSHLPLSFPGWPRMKILPIVMQPGHIPVVAFFGPLRIIFCVFLRPIIHTAINGLLNLIFKGRGEGDLNPRVLANIGLAILRPTRLGDPRTKMPRINL